MFNTIIVVDDFDCFYCLEWFCFFLIALDGC